MKKLPFNPLNMLNIFHMSTPAKYEAWLQDTDSLWFMIRDWGKYPLIPATDLPVDWKFSYLLSAQLQPVDFSQSKI